MATERFASINLALGFYNADEDQLPNQENTDQQRVQIYRLQAQTKKWLIVETIFTCCVILLMVVAGF